MHALKPLQSDTDDKLLLVIRYVQFHHWPNLKPNRKQVTFMSVTQSVRHNDVKGPPKRLSPLFVVGRRCSRELLRNRTSLRQQWAVT